MYVCMHVRIYVGVCIACLHACIVLKVVFKYTIAVFCACLFYFGPFVYLLCDSCDSCDLHSFSGFYTYGCIVSTSLLGPRAAGLGQRDPIDVAIKDAP